MSCCPPYTQIFDSSAPARSNTYTVVAPPRLVTEVRAFGIQEGQEIAVLVQDPANPRNFIPLDLGSGPVVLTADNPEVDLPPGTYRLRPNAAAAAATNPPVTIGTHSYGTAGLTSAPGYYPDGAGGWIEVEVVRNTIYGDPLIYYAGTDTRVPDTDPELLRWHICCPDTEMVAGAFIVDGEPVENAIAVYDGTTLLGYMRADANGQLSQFTPLSALSPAGRPFVPGARTVDSEPPGPDPEAPQNLVAPLVTGPGTVQVGDTFSSTYGTWDGSPTGYNIQWYRVSGGVFTAIPGADEQTYTATAADEGFLLGTGVVATNAAGPSEDARSNTVGPIVEEGPAPELRPNTLTNPPFSMGLVWMSENDMNHNPFIDWLKTGSQWQSYNGAGPSRNYDELVTLGAISEDGVVNSVPADNENITMQVLGSLPAYVSDGDPIRLRLFYEGAGEFYLNGVSDTDWSVPGQVDATFTPTGGSAMFISVWGVTTPLRFTGLIEHRDLAAFADGEKFNTRWLDLIRNERILRFRYYQMVDLFPYDQTVDWADRYHPERITYQGLQGVPVEVMVDIANRVGADPWFSFISSANDAYVSAFSTIVRDRLSPDLRPYFELSNKVWDASNWHTFFYFQALANTWFSDTSLQSIMEAYGGRSAEVFQVVNTVFSAMPARARKVIQSWTPNEAMSRHALEGYQWVAQSPGTRQPPHTYATDYGLHALLDGGIRYEWLTENMTIVQGWMDTLTQSQIFDNMAAAFRDPGTVGLGDPENPGEGRGYNLVDMALAYQRQQDMLEDYPALNVICYEGGSHLSVPPSKQGDPIWVNTYRDFHRSAQYASVRDDQVEQWYDYWPLPSNVFNQSAEIRRPDQNNAEGLCWYVDDTVDNLQHSGWVAQRAARTGEPGRGDAFIGPQDLL